MRVPSLARRLTVACLAVLVVAIAGFDAFLYTQMDSRLSADLDRQLVDRAGLAKRLDGSLGAQDLADRLAGAGVTATVRRAGQTYTGRPTPPPSPPGAGGRHGRPPSPPAPPRDTVTHVSRDGGTLTLTQPLRDGTLVLRTDRGPVDHDLRRLLALEALGSALTLALAALVVTLLVRRVVAPVDALTRLATSIAHGSTGRRLNPDRTGTELGRMAGAFDAMLDSLEASTGRAVRSEERLRELLSDVSHELRTPLAGVIASAEALLRGGAPLAPESERMLVLIVGQARRSGRLVDDLLTLSRLERGERPATEPVELAAVVREEAQRTRMLAPRMTVTVTGAIGGAVPGDGDRLAQIVANLLDNARHAAGPDGAIAISLAAAAGDDGAGDTARVEVSDDGPGVPPGQRERIFERLVRLDPSRSGGHSGLGLSIARAIAVAHSGALWCADAERGARFVLELPLGARSAGARRAPPQRGEQALDGSARIGMVDRDDLHPVP